MFTKKMRRALMCGSALVVVAGLDGTASQVWAQSSASDNMETVTVTGSLIRGIQPAGSNLVTVNSTDIEASGAITTDELLGQMPLINNAFNTHAVEGIAISGGSFVPEIRPNMTSLSLLDGNNVVGAGTIALGVDPGFIPTSVLSRVDVLPDGASSIYGANATSGVINYMTRNTYEGFQVRTTLGLADGYTSFNGNVMAGVGWGGGGGGDAYLAFEHKSNTYLMDADRSYEAMDLTSLGGRDTRGTACALPNITVGSNNYALTSNAVANTPGALAAAVTGPFGGLNSVTNAGQINRCDTNSYTSLFPEQEQNGIFGAVHQHIMNGVEFSAKLLWSTRLDEAKLSQLSATGTINSTNPYFQSIAGETSQTVQLNFAPYLGSNSYDNMQQITLFQVVPKLSIDLPFGDWHTDLTLNYGRSASYGNRRGANSAVLQTALTQSTGAPALVGGTSGNAVDPYNLNLTNPTLLNEILNNEAYVGSVQHQLQYQAVANGTLYELPGGPVKAAIGGKFDREDYVGEEGEVVPYGMIGGDAPPSGQYLPFVAGHNIVESGFAEINVPLVGEKNRLPFVDALTFNLSGRIDSYSNFGTTDNYKIGFTYDPFAAISIRGTHGTSFDAPSLGNQFGPNSFYSYASYPTSANTIVPPGTSAADAHRPAITVSGANPNLGPELGDNWSIGTDFHPTSELGVDLTGLNLSVTRWHNRITNQISNAPYTNAALLFTPTYASYYIINPTQQQLEQRYGNLAIIGSPGAGLSSLYNTPGVSAPYIAYDARANNLGERVVEGFDFSADYTRDIGGFGSITGALSGTIDTEDQTRTTPGSPWSYSIQYGVPLAAYTASVQTITGPLTARAWVQYSPGFALAPTSQSYSLYNQTRVGAFYPVNLFVSYQMGDLADWLDGTTVSVTVTNIGDENPPLLLSGGPAFGSTLGRYTEFSLRQEF